MSRLPQIDLAVLLQQQNPQIDLRIHAYESSTRDFIKAVTNFKNKAIALITERRNAQAAEVKRAAEKIQLLESETNECRLKEIEMLATIEKEKEERKEAEASVSALRRQLASAKDKSTKVALDIEQNRAVTDSLREERDKEKGTLQSRASQAAHELRCYESALQCAIEGIGENQLLIRFTHLDPSDWNREFTVVLDISNRMYRVLTSAPLLPGLPILLEDLNRSRDVFRFIKEVRKAFVEQATSDL